MQMLLFFFLPVIAFEKWQAWAEEKACCDFAFKMRIPTPLNEDLEDQMRELSMENNINCFLASMEEFNDANLINFYQACASSGIYHLYFLTYLAVLSTGSQLVLRFTVHTEVIWVLVNI